MLVIGQTPRRLLSSMGHWRKRTEDVKQCWNMRHFIAAWVACQWTPKIAAWVIGQSTLVKMAFLHGSLVEARQKRLCWDRNTSNNVLLHTSLLEHIEHRTAFAGWIVGGRQGRLLCWVVHWPKCTGEDGLPPWVIGVEARQNGLAGTVLEHINDCIAADVAGGRH